jgi:hypothetical protein
MSATVAAMADVLAVRHHDSILGTLIFPSFRDRPDRR